MISSDSWCETAAACYVPANIPRFVQKDMRELPFSQFYTIGDQWSGSFSARIYEQAELSRYHGEQEKA